ncbi:MAG: RluA family pseudouridine synthase [Gammaproteobacteria bacterium]|nr:RluA family pseudouridine synthase [Gammaproteobacteria bacterium]
MTAKIIEQQQVSFLTVDGEHADRRLDNFLIGHFGSIPKTRIYQMIRKGEVRVNKGRIKQNYRLQTGDTVRIPPVHLKPRENSSRPPERLSELIRDSIIHEDEYLIAINKPSNVAVHSGSGVEYGVIEILRAQRPEAHFLELIHRLDRATSGCLLIAKNHKTLRGMHDLLKSGGVNKNYLALLKGQLMETLRTVDVPLSKKGTIPGDRKVTVDNTGKQALTHFHLLERFSVASLSRVELMTGRTHQIRVHAAHIEHPVAGDDKYGDWEFNRAMKKSGLKRLFLHAETLSFEMPDTGKQGAGKQINLRAQLPHELDQCLNNLA